MNKEEYLQFYKNYKSSLAAKASHIVTYKESWSDEFCRNEINRLYNSLIDFFKNVDFTIFLEPELRELDFNYFDENLICMPVWAIDCLQVGTKIYSINGESYIVGKLDRFSKDTRFGITAYGFLKSQLRDTKIKEILNG